MQSRLKNVARAQTAIIIVVVVLVLLFLPTFAAVDPLRRIPTAQRVVWPAKVCPVEEPTVLHGALETMTKWIRLGWVATVGNQRPVSLLEILCATVRF